MKKDRKPLHRYTSGITFSAYTPQEILKLSVVEVKNTHNFDALGYPTTGGVYDPALGPNERNELCSTCSQNYVHCPGHTGHIQLPLPVFNPVFFNTLFQILRGTCLSCHLFVAPAPVKLLVRAQLKALDHGLVDVSKELEELVHELLHATDTNSALQVQSVLDNHLANVLNGKDKDCTKGMEIKNVIDCRYRIIRWFVQENMMKNNRICHHCKAHKHPLYNVNKNRIIMSSVRSKRMVLNKENNRVRKAKENMNPDGNMIEDEAVIEEDELDKNSDKKTNELLKAGEQTLLTPTEVRKHMREIWKKEKEIMQSLYKILATSDHEIPVDIFFLDVIPVPPSRFRPISIVGDKKFENPQSAMLSKVVQSCFTLKYLLNLVNNASQIGEVSDSAKMLLAKIPGMTNTEKLQNAWSGLQNQVNSVADSDQDIFNNKGTAMGVKQVIEKKEGLFRKNMMGKRVDYAARSVISPDPFIGIDEIGIPEVFAKKLTYPQYVTPWNVRELRQLVMNGPETYPGATLVKNEYGETTLLSNNTTQRHAIAKTLLTPSLGEDLKGPKVVYRHLKNGDILLVNRQPTLHRPSIMAHRARILPGEKTLRLHYSNCKTYNADFDGDEMNIHFPQNEMARAEAELIANVTNHYLVPKDGTPLGGLIQDHIVAGIHMTIRGQFFSKQDYQQLVFSALAEKNGPILTLPPSIIKPEELWSGKQVFSTVLKNLIPAEKKCINLIGTAKISSKNWKESGNSTTSLAMTESDVIVSEGELLCGVLDKAHYGPTPYGLIHCCYELYGGNVSSQILTSLGRLFTYYLRIHGFTLGIEDILIKEKVDKKRRKVMKKAQKVGLSAASQTFSLEEVADLEIIKKKYLEAHYSKDDRLLKILDMHMKSETDKINNKINSLLMPSGLLKQFPENNLQLMVQSGAKGASVNCMQISCLLGQIELEGRRPPLMLSGRTLPSFLPYEISPRAGGFIDGRFLTGIQPQEYFFHCMAGREGLIDTAVKTSRSGYLQRCLIKHLEGVCVNYDLTVRDSDGSVIQFLYGEDGLDIQKAQFFKDKFLPFLASNSSIILNYDEMEKFEQITNSQPPKKKMKSIRKWKKKHQSIERSSPFLLLSKANPQLSKNELQELWFSLSEEDKKRYKKASAKCPDPVVSIYRPDLCFGSVTETLDQLIENFVSVNPESILKYSDDDESAFKIDDVTFRNMMYQKIMHSLCPSGESVGLLAAQSIGEPSTQMTLNTFHFAGRGEMNVTLGIPRLREILMVASSHIATPSMEVPFLDHCSTKVAEELKLKLNQVNLNEILEDVHVHEWLSINGNERSRLYCLRLNFLPHSEYANRFFVQPSKILHFIETKFIKQLIKAMESKFKLLAESRLLTSAMQLEKRKANTSEEEENAKVDQGEGDDSSNDEGEDDDAAEAQHKRKRQQEREYEELEDEEKEVEESDIDDSDDENEAAELVNSEVEHDADEYSATPSNFLESKKHKKLDKRALQRRIQKVINTYQLVSDYSFDEQQEEWCEITFKLRINNSKIDLLSVVNEEVRKAVVHEVPNIKRAIISENGGKTWLKTEGVNIEEMFKYDKILNLNRLYSNDIHSVAKVYGIEAATRAIFKEIQSVFQVYGIHVDARHLLLIADYMTFSGVYKPFNRVGLESNSSPLQQMSFETTMHFLKSATLAGRSDSLKSPSAQIVVGKPVSLGTGSMEILIPLK